MTHRLITETASTSPGLREKLEPTSATSVLPEGAAFDAKPGIVLAGIFLWAALTTAGQSGTAPIGPYFRRRDESVAESSTKEVERDPELLKQVKAIFGQGANEFFQDGMSSNFSRSLVAFLRQYGRAAFRSVAEYVFSGGGNPTVVSEAMRWLADYNDPATLPQLWAILQHTLKDQSPRVRDGAILGFAALDDPRARSLLIETQKSEPIPELQRLIQQVIDQLNETHASPAPQHSREPLA